MNYDYYLKRQKTSLEDLINKKKITDYTELVKYFNSVRIKPPTYEEVKSLFEERVENVEKRPAIKSSVKKKRVSSKKSSKPKTDDSASTGGSGSRQSVRKSPAKRQRKRKGNNDESVQLTSGSEDTK